MVREVAGVADLLTNQVEYHPYLAQDAVLAEAERDGHVVTAYSPLAKGRVAGSGRGERPDPTIGEIAAGHGKTPAQVVLRWLLQQPRVAAIPRSSKAERRAENLDVFDFRLSEEEMAALFGLARSDGRLIDPPFAPDWD
jgi:diketogulonate reductase-like aldo/keto reductase